MTVEQQLERPWAYTAFTVEVSQTARVSPGFVRVTFTAPELRYFAPWGFDQRVKIVLPLEDGSVADFGLLDEPTPHPSHWHARWRQLPLAKRNALRTYTPSGIRPEQSEIDIDFFIHDPPGPASQWAAGARKGDRLVVTGPDARNGWTGYGIHWQPGEASRFLLIGDETALPAIANICRGLDFSLGADDAAEAINVLAETTSAADAAVLPDHPLVTVVQTTSAPGIALEELSREWADRQTSAQLDDQGLYVWVAGESGAVTRIRRYFTRELGFAKDRVSFLGYWTMGARLAP